MTVTTKKICSGLYSVSNGERTVMVDHWDHLNGWIARAEWDRYHYTDIVPTKAAAKAAAIHMLENPLP